MRQLGSMTAIRELDELGISDIKHSVARKYLGSGGSLLECFKSPKSPIYVSCDYVTTFRVVIQIGLRANSHVSTRY